MRKSILLIALISLVNVLFGQTAVYDVVLKNGKVIDPETEFEGIRNVGIIGDRIAEISEKALKGKVEIDVTNLVVAPGFIDLHVHGMTNKAHEYQVRDGVTTALELEAGKLFLGDWIAGKSGNSIVNFGATASHSSLRALAMGRYNHFFEAGRKIIEEEGINSPKLSKLQINMGRSGYQALSAKEIEQMRPMLQAALEVGALGIGVPVGYYPGATHEEIYRVYELAAEKQAPIFSHTRGFGLPGIHEAIANATTSGAPLHIVHANSLSLGEIQVTLDMVAAAQDRGLDITTEVYPYTPGSTLLESALFDTDWQEQIGITYNDLQWEATGERLTETTFKEYRKKEGVGKHPLKYIFPYRKVGYIFAV